MGVALVGATGARLSPFVDACARLGLPCEWFDPKRVSTDPPSARLAVLEVTSIECARAQLAALHDGSDRVVLAVLDGTADLDLLLELGVDDCVLAPVDVETAVVRLRLCLSRDEHLRLALAAARMATFAFRAGEGSVLFGSQRGTLAFSPSLPVVTGLPASAFESRDGEVVRLTDLVHPPDRPAVIDAVERLLTHDEPLHVELRIHADRASSPGQERWLLVNARAFHDGGAEGAGGGGALSVRGTVMDVTARKTIELSLRHALVEVRERDERFRLVARATSDAVWDWDLRTDVVTWFENFTTLFGYAFPDGRTPLTWWSDNLHPDDRERVVDGIHDAIELGQETWQDEYRFRCADGTFAQVLDRGLVLRDAEGRPLRMIGAMMDITERRALQARLLVADRLASVGTLAAGVAHEVNNPLAYVLLSLSRAAQSLAPRAGVDAVSAEALERVREAQGGAERVRRIVQDLRVFARADDDVREQVDLREVVRTSVHLADNEIRHRARLELALDPVPLVEGSPGRLGQVVVNLLVNAAQAIPEGAAASNQVRVRTYADVAGRAVLEVSDTGQGVPAELKDRIFDPFYTTKPKSEGTGLGLTICAGIVASLGGTIDVESEPGRGSTFRIVLPRAAASGRMRAAAPVDPGRPGADGPSRPSSSRGAPPDRPSRRRVLVVDDEPLIGKSLGFMLGEWYDVQWTTSGRDALARLDSGVAYDVVLCDLMMPEMTGMDLHAELARRDPALAARVVFLTGGAFTARARAFLEQSTNPTVEKPFEIEALQAAIAQVLGEPAREPRAAVTSR